jgi:hypothetical protein
LIGWHPSYIRGFLEGVRQAVVAEKASDWTCALELCKWAVDQSGLQSADDSSQEGRAWRWLRQTVNDLLGSGLKESPASIPIDLRGQVLPILAGLSNDPDPSAEREAERAAGRDDHYTLAINSIRGRAIENLIACGVWIKLSLRPSESGEVDSKELAGLEELLEVNLATDRSLAIRSLYGVHLHRLLWFDGIWTKRVGRSIFSQRLGDEGLDRAAWEGFLAWGYRPANRELFELLRSSYERAVQQLRGEARAENDQDSPVVRLGENLINLYTAGFIDLESADQFISRFFANGSDEGRARVMRWIGHSLRTAAGDVEVSAVARFQRLWEYRITGIVNRNEINISTKEMLAFSEWFACGKFPEVWAAAQLLRVYSLTSQAPADYSVVEHLLTTSETEPLLAIRILNAMSKQSVNALELDTTAVREIVETGLRHPDEEARRLAKETVSRLLARGCSQLADIFHPPTGGA